MNQSRTFVIRCIGLRERDARLLQSISLLPSARTRRYQLAPGGTDRGDIYVVDLDNPYAVEQWSSIAQVRAAPVLLVFSNGDPPRDRHSIKRPILPSRLLELLDEITMSELGFAPELLIGKDDAVSTGVAIRAASKSAWRYLALIVDDSPTVRAQLEIALAAHEVGVHRAATAEEAMSLLSKSSYDIVFLDVELPGADGYQVCKSIKRSKQHRDTPVIMLTGKSSTFDRIKGSLAGCDTYLTKPVEGSLFGQVLRKYLRASARGAPTESAPRTVMRAC